MTLVSSLHDLSWKTASVVPICTDSDIKTAASTQVTLTQIKGGEDRRVHHDASVSSNA
jgi:hypothetical protein